MIQVIIYGHIMLFICLLEVIPAQSAYHYRLTLLYPLLSLTVPTPPIHTLVRLSPSSPLTFPPLLSPPPSLPYPPSSLPPSLPLPPSPPNRSVRLPPLPSARCLRPLTGLRLMPSPSDLQPSGRPIDLPY